ncbi:MAG: type II secretion system protein J [Rhodopirellula sp. JB053]
MTSRSTARRGSSLIEIMVVLSVSSTLLVLAVGWIHQSIRLASILRSHERHHQSVLRLARQFRDDAHLAARVFQNQNEIRFWAEDSEIRYQIDDSTVTRIYQTPSDDEPPHRESYQLAVRCQASFDLPPDSDWVTLTVRRRPPSSAAEPRTSNPDASADSTPREPGKVGLAADLVVRAAIGRWSDERSDNKAPPREETLP